MYIKFAEIQNGEAVFFCEMVEPAFNKLIQENQNKIYAIIPNEEDIFAYAENKFYKNGWKNKSPQPSPYHIWDNELEKWIPNIVDAQKSAFTLVTKEMESRMYLPCGGFDADKTARERISGTIARLQRGDGLPAGWMGWRDAENNMHWVADDAATVLANLTALSRAIEDREQALLVAAWQHKANIASLTTIEDIMNYNVEEGWNG